ITWTPTVGQIGLNAVSVMISDDQGATTTQDYDILVVPEAANHAPMIFSTPPTQAAVGASYQYRLQAVDPERDALVFSLPTAPGGMVIDPTTGVINWTPALNQSGQNPVTVSVTDGRGGTDRQDFQVTVDANRPPVITSDPVTDFTIPTGTGSPPSGDV